MTQTEAVKASVSIAGVAMALGSSVRGDRMTAAWRGGDGLNVSLDRERGLFFDHRDGVGGDVFDLIKLNLNCGFRDAKAWLTAFDGGPQAAGLYKPKPAATDQSRIDRALTLWSESSPLPGTAGAGYYDGRGLFTDSLDDVVRWHPCCPFGTDRLGCVVALMRDIGTNVPCGLHRTALDEDGHKIGRKMLGRAKGAAIKLVDDVDVTRGLGIAEGIETALSILQTGWSPVWALGSAGAIERFPLLDGIEVLTIWSDHDDVGLKAARACAKHWSQEGCEVHVRRPSVPDFDFNDAAREISEC